MHSHAGHILYYTVIVDFLLVLHTKGFLAVLLWVCKHFQTSYKPVLESVGGGTPQIMILAKKEIKFDLIHI